MEKVTHKNIHTYAFMNAKVMIIIETKKTSIKFISLMLLITFHSVICNKDSSIHAEFLYNITLINQSLTLSGVFHTLRNESYKADWIVSSNCIRLSRIFVRIHFCQHELSITYNRYKLKLFAYVKVMRANGMKYATESNNIHSLMCLKWPPGFQQIKF